MFFSSGEQKGTEPWRVLQLPLAKEGNLAHGLLELGFGYYEAVMGGGEGAGAGAG